MYKKHLILGIGIGIFISSLICFISFKIYKLNSLENINSLDYEDDYVIDRATEMGMIFFDKVYFENNVSKDATAENSGENEYVISPEDYVYVVIPKDCTAIEVANILESKGVITDKTTFTNYIIDANLQRKLNYGDFLIPKNISNEEIANMLIKSN